MNATDKTYFAVVDSRIIAISTDPDALLGHYPGSSIVGEENDLFADEWSIKALTALYNDCHVRGEGGKPIGKFESRTKGVPRTWAAMQSMITNPSVIVIIPEPEPTPEPVAEAPKADKPAKATKAAKDPAAPKKLTDREKLRIFLDGLVHLFDYYEPESVMFPIHDAAAAVGRDAKTTSTIIHLIAHPDRNKTPLNIAYDKAERMYRYTPAK